MSHLPPTTPTNANAAGLILAVIIMAFVAVIVAISPKRDLGRSTSAETPPLQIAGSASPSVTREK